VGVEVRRYLGPRQNGKSQLIVARALAGVLLFGEKTIIISAHETDTAREIWRRMIDVIEDNPTLEARVTAR
jgi:ABC-type Na+ transport system ATPase subunit NatA